jgi:hypothetical protein
VLELEDLEDRPLDLDVVAVLELVRRNDGESALLQEETMGLPFSPSQYGASDPRRRVSIRSRQPAKRTTVAWSGS